MPTESELLNLIGELIQGLIPRYRKLAESGQIELSTTPHYHPLAPLLIDFSSARDSMPGVNLPTEAAYPGREEPCRISVELSDRESFAALRHKTQRRMACGRRRVGTKSRNSGGTRLSMERQRRRGFGQ